MKNQSINLNIGLIITIISLEIRTAETETEIDRSRSRSRSRSMHRIENLSQNEQATDNESDINLPGTSKGEIFILKHHC